MVKGIFPRYSKSRVNKAGDSIRRKSYTEEDIEVLENWRASHAYIINTFQANLRGRTKGTAILVGQRLKRRATIIDKLNRQDNMQLARMHDIAGCRIIFPDNPSLEEFRRSFHRSKAKHIRTTAEKDQFNYIVKPKMSGYRGIHDVYKYEPYSPSASSWRGLLIEIQYRTKAQHAWATAVEIADLLTQSRGKFSQATSSYEDFFRASSEIIARTVEDSTSCLSKLSNSEVVEFFYECNAHTNLLDILDRTNVVQSNITEKYLKNRLNIILIYPYDQTEAFLEVQAFSETRRAIEVYEQLEKDRAGVADIVLVRAEDAATLTKVFQNYFTDARDFVDYIKRGLIDLEK